MVEKVIFKTQLLDLRMGWEGSLSGGKILPVLRLSVTNREAWTQLQVQVLAKYLHSWGLLLTFHLANGLFLLR